MKTAMMALLSVLSVGTAHAWFPSAVEPVDVREGNVESVDSADSPVATAVKRGHAEGLYLAYGAGTNGAVRFGVTTLAAGELEELGDTPFGDLLAPRRYVIEDQQFGTQLLKARFSDAVLSAVSSDPSDLETTADGFESVGSPVELGRYRKLLVVVSIGSDVRQHEALELCWPSQGHCVVLDPAIPFLQSKVETRQRLIAERWGPRLFVVERNDSVSSLRSQAAVCGLASNPGVKDYYYYWPAWSVDYKNIFGMTLVHKDMGAQKSGIRCDANCKPQPYGFSNASSCWGTLGWNCAANNAFGYGSTGSSGKWIAETKTTHKWAGSASANVTVMDQGSINVNLQWSVDGGVDANGGRMMDSCGFF